MVSVQNPSSAASKKHTLPTRTDICFKGKGWKRIIQANEPRKYAGVAILIYVKIDFKQKLIRKNWEGQYVLIKGKIRQEEHCNPKHLYTKYKGTQAIKETPLQLKFQTDSHTVTVGDFHILLLLINKSSRQKTSREMLG